MDLAGYLLSAIVGVSLGLIGSGGSILTVPILVYIMGVNPVLATAYSLFIVGSTALVGGLQSALQKKVDFKTVLIFGIPSIAAVYATRMWLVPFIPKELFSIGSFVITKPIALMLLFALVMILASISMIKSGKDKEETDDNAPMKYNYPMILVEGALVGLLTGLVGAGGGFLIIPALVLLARMPMKLAVGTSLFIIAAKSLIGFTGDLQGSQAIDWKLLGSFTGFAVVGIFMGIWLSKKIPGDKLKKAFGWFVLVMGIYIIVKEIFFLPVAGINKSSGAIQFNILPGSKIFCNRNSEFLTIKNIMEQLQVTIMPRIGDKAPDFEAVTTTGKLAFSEYNKGSWVIFFSHPADFTPVCTTEMSGFANEKAFFAAHNTKLVGLSIDSIHAHIAWVNAVHEKTGVLFEFPIVADIDMSISKLYGMLQPGESETAAVRAVFIIDPEGKVRLIMYYPLNVGRNMAEIKRTLLALQTSDENKCAMPLDWQPGEKVIVPAPKTIEALAERKNSNLEMVDWYLAKRPL